MPRIRHCRMVALPLRMLILAHLPVAEMSAQTAVPPPARPVPLGVPGCPGLRTGTLLGLLARPLTLAEMVTRLEQGCLALDEVRFRPGQDTIVSLSPAQFALVARALGLARGAYRIAVPAESTPGWPPDTLQARRRGTRLRDELAHYGASLERLLEDPGRSVPLPGVPPGSAVPMLVRVPDP